MQTKKQRIFCVSNDGQGPSVFTHKEIDLYGSSDRMLSEQQSALNFRLRSSDKDYASSWHVAGDPTLLLILRGRVELCLRDGSKAEFGTGEMFIAQDYLNQSVSFCELHGHCARVVGGNTLEVLHLKLEKR